MQGLVYGNVEALCRGVSFEWMIRRVFFIVSSSELLHLFNFKDVFEDEFRPIDQTKISVPYLPIGGQSL